MLDNNPMTLDQIRAAAPAAFAPIASPEMSGRYSHVTTSNLITALMDDGWRVVGADQTKSRKEDNAEHGKHRITLTHSLLPTHSEGRPQMYIGNSGNGESAVRLLGGFLRMACLNQNYAGVKVVGGVFNHIGASLEDRIVAGARELRANFDKVIAAYELWKAIDVSPEQQGQFARAAVALRWPTEQVYVDTRYMLRVRRYNDLAHEATLWGTYNRTQEALIRGGFHATFIERDSNRVRTVRKISGLTASERINTGLWELTSRVALGVPFGATIPAIAAN